MNKLALFLTGLLLGLLFGRVVALSRARVPYPSPTSVAAPDNDEDTVPCEYTTELRQVYP